MLCLCTYSDRAQARGIPSMCVFAIGIVGWSILYGVDPVGASASDLHVRYCECFRPREPRGSADISTYPPPFSVGVICVVTAGCESPKSLSRRRTMGFADTKSLFASQTA